MKRGITILLLLTAIAALLLSSRVQYHLVDLRRAYHLDQADPLENSPPLVAFTTVALGGFRGIIADILWIRASSLQDEGKYFELVQLSDWITKLEPRFPEVWAFHAWNLAYNISVLFDDFGDRWRWVRSGIWLLRDEGLRYNPAEPQLYRELGWLFQHKIGGAYDQAHHYYKQAWAREMSGLFRGPRPDYDRIRTAPTGSVTALKAKIMKEKYKLLPEVMEKIDNRYGPLDWRLPQAHAIYWASRGQPYAKKFEAIALSRMIFQSVTDAFRKGRVYEDHDENMLITAPNLDLLPRITEVFEEIDTRFPDAQTFLEAYTHYITEAIVILYTYNRDAEAQRLFEALKTQSKANISDTTMESFIARAFIGTREEVNRANALRALRDAVYQGLYWKALGDRNRAKGFNRLAKLIRQEYTSEKQTEEANLPPPAEVRAEQYDQVLQILRSARSQRQLEETDEL